MKNSTDSQIISVAPMMDWNDEVSIQVQIQSVNGNRNPHVAPMPHSLSLQFRSIHELKLWDEY